MEASSQIKFMNKATDVKQNFYFTFTYSVQVCFHVVMQTFGCAVVLSLCCLMSLSS